jgi:hypothetical protein
MARTIIKSCIHNNVLPARAATGSLFFCRRNAIVCTCFFNTRYYGSNLYACGCFYFPECIATHIKCKFSVSEKLSKNDLLGFIIGRKVAGENTGNGGSPRLVFSPTAKWEMFFHF